jgi:MFS family permease
MQNSLLRIARSHPFSSEREIASADAVCIAVAAIPDPPLAEVVLPAPATTKLTKQEIRTSLKASTLDSVFSSIFGCVVHGVLLTNFLLQLGANSIEIGLLSSVPMLMNFLQPLGAYLADRHPSRRGFNLWTFGISRALWLILVPLILLFGPESDPHQLVVWTLIIVVVTHLLGALGCPSWLSWMSVLVPHRLRGRYFGIRNSAGNLTSLLSVPLMGMMVSAWGDDSMQGFAVVLLLAIIAGLLSLGCQFFMSDVNPLEEHQHPQATSETPEKSGKLAFLLKDTNFLMFLLYFGLWMFAINLSSPFFNLYLLQDLAVNVQWVTIYTSLSVGANLLMLMVWGKLADRVGNRAILLIVGIFVAITPLLWLGTGSNSISLWIWIPLIHLQAGSTWAAIDLCSNNIQMEIAPKRQPSTYFAVAAAVAGLAGALGTTAGGFLAQYSALGGLAGLFALSAGLRLVALLPLLLVREPRHRPLMEVLQEMLPAAWRSVLSRS